MEVAKEVDLDEQLGVDIDGKRIALFRLEEGVFALDDVCSHEYSLLSEGEIWDDEVYCPKHGSRFEIKSGAVRSLPAFRPVCGYEVKIENGSIYIAIEEKS